MVKLKPCPFCGGKGKVIKWHRQDKFFVVCQVCGASVGNASDCRKVAIQVWNTRYEPPTPGGIIVPFGNARFNK